MKSHQRFCDISDNCDFTELFQEDILNEAPAYTEDIYIYTPESVPAKKDAKKGLRLPKSKSEWNEANEFFKLHLSTSSNIENVENEICRIQNCIYDYFKLNFGVISEDIENNEMKNKYDHFSKRKLKKGLRDLKSNQTENQVDEIRYVARLIRKKYEYGTNVLNSINHNESMKNSMWKYCKDIFEKSEIVKPDFDREQCEQYFRENHRQNSENRSFNVPPWMKQLNEPAVIFDEEPPSYQEITKIINNIKSSGSPCPFDHVSIIILKRCPILRTIIHKIISHCWSNKMFPQVWKSAFTILIYK